MLKVLQVLFSLLVLSGLVWLAGPEQLWQVLTHLRLEYFALLMALSAVMIWVSCLKWRLFIRAFGSDSPLGQMMALYTVSYFINTFIPSYVGGDVHRSYHLGEVLGNKKRVFAATVLERLTGLFAMAFLGVSFVLFRTKETQGFELPIGILGFVALVLAGLVFWNRLNQLAHRAVRCLANARYLAAIREPALNVLNKLDAASEVCRGNGLLFCKAMALSLIFHSLTVFNTYLAARAVGWDNPGIGALFVTVPLVLIVSIVPITPSGLGIQEGAFTYFLEQVGATRAEALGTGLVLRIKILLLGLIGALFWLRLRSFLKGQPLENKLELESELTEVNRSC